MRRQWTSRNLSVVGVLVAAALGFSCGGGLGDAGVTGPTSTTEAPFLEESGTFDASGRATSLVCHKGRDLFVAPSAVPAHLAHGDTEGPCQAAAAACPCYSAAQVAAAAACEGVVTLCFQSGGEYLCEIQCPGETYDYFLSSDSCSGPQASSSLDTGQFQACFDVLQAECPSFDIF